MATTEAMVSVVVKKFADFLTQEAELPVRVRDLVVSIHIVLQNIHPYLRNAEGMLKKEDIKTWIPKVRDIACEAEDILDTLITRTERRKKQQTIIKRYAFIFNDLFAGLKVLKEITLIDNNFLKVCIYRPRDLIWIDPIPVEHPTKKVIIPTTRRRYDDVVFGFDEDEESKVIIPTTRRRYDDVVFGFDEDEESLIRRLTEEGPLPERRRVISIVGEGGTGKTTLAQLVYNSDRTINHFDLRAWIYVSQGYSKRGLLNDTYRNIMNSVTEDILTEEQKKRRLSEFLVKKKRYLIVLDDVCDVEAWSFLEEAFPDTGYGSRILLTTRHDSVASGVDPTTSSSHPPHKMKRLDDDSSWSFFSTMTSLTGQRIVLVGKEIVKKCGGLPLAIKVIGSLLNRRNTIEEWERVLIDDIWSRLETQDPFLTLLELIYQDLHFFCRPLFLYFSIFPKEYDIPVRRLFGLWQAEEIVTLEEEERKVSWEDLAHDYLEELIDRNLIQVVRWRLDGKPKTCRIAGIVRELFLSKACDFGILHIHQNSNSTSSSQPPSAVRRLVEYTDINDLSSLEPHIHKSRSYLSFNFRKGDVPAEVTGQFLGRVIQKGGFGLLRVLDLEQVYKPKLPESLGKLYLLKYLGLRWTFLDALPSSVGDLSFLETLDVKHTNVSHLPSSIWKLKYLQHLYLNEIHLDIPVGHIALGNLQTLLGLSIHMENPVKDILYRLITLKKLGLTCQGTTEEVFVEWISKLTALETLRLRSRDRYGQPSNLKVGSFSSLTHLSNLYLVGRLSSPHSALTLSALKLPQNLTVLTLSVSKLELDPMPILEKLPKLRALRLFAHSYIGKKMVCSDRGFPSLCILKLWMLEELEEWSVEDGAMANLEELEIRCCKRLNKVPQELLFFLRALVLTNMPHAFIEKVEAEKKNFTSLSVNTLEFPTFADQVTSLEGESSEIVPNISA